MNTCGMCACEVAKLANSHIYPASMTREYANGSEIVVARTELGHVNLATAGLRDRIVCLNCEALFHDADEEAVRFRRRALMLDDLIAMNHGSTQLPTLSGNAGKLHTFALQTILRAALSRHTPSVPRSVLSDWVTARLLAGVGTIEDGPEVFIRIIRGPLGGVSMNPAFHADAPMPFYTLHLPNFTLYVAASAQGGLLGFDRSLVLKPGEAVTVWRSRIQTFERDRILNGIDPVSHKLSDVFAKLARTRTLS